MFHVIEYAEKGVIDEKGWSRKSMILLYERGMDGIDILYVPCW